MVVKNIALKPVYNRFNVSRYDYLEIQETYFGVWNVYTALFSSSRSLRNYFCDRNDPLKRVGFLCPDYTGFLNLMEIYFMESLTSVVDCSVDNRSVSRRSQGQSMRSPIQEDAKISA